MRWFYCSVAVNQQLIINTGETGIGF